MLPAVPGLWALGPGPVESQHLVTNFARVHAVLPPLWFPHWAQWQSGPLGWGGHSNDTQGLSALLCKQMLLTTTGHSTALLASGTCSLKTARGQVRGRVPGLRGPPLSTSGRTGQGSELGPATSVRC